MITIDKVYIVIQDNGESWEDYQEWVERVYTNKEAAEKFCEENLGYFSRVEEKEITYD